MGSQPNWCFATIALLLAIPSCAVADDLAFMVTSSGQFGVINLNTGTFTFRGNMSTILSGLGQTPDGKLYGSDSNSVVYQVNPADGTLTALSRNGVVNSGMGSTTSGLYGLDSSLNLNSINPSNGAAMLIGPTGLHSDVGPPTVGLSAGSPTLYIAYGPSFSSATLYSINTTTGAASPVGPAGVDGIGALVLVNGTLYGGSNWQGSTQTDTVNVLNPATGTGALSATVSGGAAKFYGLAPFNQIYYFSQLALGGGWQTTLPRSQLSACR